MIAFWVVLFVLVVALMVWLTEPLYRGTGGPK